MHPGDTTAATPGRAWTTVRRATGEVLRARVLILPYQGGTAAPWRPAAAELPADVEVLGLTLPPRGRRDTEPAVTSTAEVVRSLDELDDRPTVPTIVFGHGFGALLALPVAARLGAECHTVVVSGPAPTTAPPPGAAGTATDVALAADLRLAADARGVAADIRLDRPILVVGGPPEPWRRHTGATVATVDVVGDLASDTASDIGSLGGGLGTDIAAGPPGPPPSAGRILAEITASIPVERAAALLCVPFAGSGASFFKPWRALAPRGLLVRGLQLPGREELSHEPPLTDMTAAAAGLLPQVEATIAEFGWVALFGHSMGGLLAYAIAALLERSPHSRLGHLFVSGSTTPARNRREPVTGRPDAEFIAAVAEFAGYRSTAFDDPQLREMLLPVLRADVAMHETYRPHDERRLTVPVTALRGSDDSLVSASDVAGWAGVTSAEATVTELPGGHMYLLTEAAAILRIVGRAARTDRREGRST